MNPKLRALLVANGLRADATEEEAWAFLDALKQKNITFPGLDPGQRSAPAGAPPTGGQQPAVPATPAAPAGVDVPASQRTFTQTELEAEVARAMVNNAVRQNAISERLRIAGIPQDDSFSRTLIDNPQVSVERASMLIMDELQKRQIPIGTGARIVHDAVEKLRGAAIDGLLMRSGIRVEKPVAGAREFRGMSLLDVCREVLELSGVSCRGLDRREVVSRALSAGSTSDFPAIFSAVVNKTLLKAYTEWPQTWRPIVAVTGAVDFKDIYSIKLSGAPDLLGLNENGEYQTAKFSDAKERYRLLTKGIKVPLTREMIINDDLRAFTRIPQLFGVAARRLEADAVFSLLLSSSLMSDGKPLFHADHNNLAATGTILGTDSLGVGRTAMRKQTGLGGERIDVIPAFLLVPVVKELDADVILRSTSLPADGMSAGVYNPWAGRLTPIADPHLDDVSATAWYLLAHPNQVPTIEVAYLEGEEQPYVEEMVDFHSDAMITKVRHDFGAGLVDHVGAYKNAGAVA